MRIRDWSSDVCSSDLLTQLLDRQQTRPQTIVDVVIAVGDLVGAIGELRLQRGLPVRQKAFGDVAKLRVARLRTMFEDAFTCLEHPVQAAKLGVIVLQHVDHPQRKTGRVSWRERVRQYE